MSQKKVDAYKERKVNRTKIMKKEKRILFIEKMIGLVLGLVVVAWVGFSFYGKVTAEDAAVKKDTVINTTALDDYYTSLSAEATEDAADTEEAAE